MYGGIVVEPETLPKLKVRSESLRRLQNSKYGCSESLRLSQQVMVLAVAEPEAVAHFTAWVVAAHETVLEFMVKLLQSLRRSQKPWHGGRRA